MEVEVAYALPQQQWVQVLDLPQGSRVVDALAAVATLEPFARLDLAQMPVGIFGELVEPDRLLAPFDRIELYRPLLVSPKEARRQRAAKTQP